jgi:hypothetical protein
VAAALALAALTASQARTTVTTAAPRRVLLRPAMSHSSLSGL